MIRCRGCGVVFEPKRDAKWCQVCRDIADHMAERLGVTTTYVLQTYLGHGERDPERLAALRSP